MNKTTQSKGRDCKNRTNKQTKQDPTTYLQETHFRFEDKNRLKVRD